MEIIKHGYLHPRRFTCEYCGCEFIADKSDYIECASQTSCYVDCPDCNHNLWFDYKDAPIHKGAYYGGR